MTVKYEILVILLNYWKAKKSEVPGVLNKKTSHRYFQKFKNGQTDLRRQEGSGRPTVIDNNHVK